MNNTLVVVPTYNERENLPPLAQRLLALPVPLDVLVEGDDPRDYRVIYLADQHVSRAATKALTAWVQAGGRLFASAGAGMFDEFNQPNAPMSDLLGIELQTLVTAKEPLRFEKQDLPFAAPLETIRWRKTQMPVFGACSRIKASDAKVEGCFS